VPFKIEINFSEPVKNVDPNTVLVEDINGVKLNGTFAAGPNNTKWVFTPTDNAILASPYDVWVNYPTQVILDAAGNKMQGLFESSFTTAAPGDLGKYDALAFKYAPNIRVGAPAAYPLAAQYEAPTRLNVDANWDITNNVAYLDDPKTKKFNSAVHYAVLESESHTFIHYVYYWSKRENKYDGEEEVRINDLAGAIVVLEKWPAERPVEVLTWFKKGAGEYIRAFSTTESGIFKGSADAEAIDGEYAEKDLFLNGRFQSWIPAGRHESCIWDDPGKEGALAFTETCILNDDKKFYEMWTLNPAAQPAAVTKAGDKWLKTGSANYELVDMLREWWPRRTVTKTIFADKFGEYSIKYLGNTYMATFSQRFVNGEGESGEGRAPWALIWDPKDGKPFQDDLEQGLVWFDTPTYLQKRHKTEYFNKAWDKTSKTGFSKDWCFNPYLGIDQRAQGDPVCPK